MTPRDTISIDLSTFDAFLFDLDGVITRTAGLHASAWKSHVGASETRLFRLK